ncbi:MAG: AEC family transporter [Clostridia bacterium]
MNSFSLAFSVVFPLFLMMALGYFLRRVGLFNDGFLKQLNDLCFKVFLSTLLFVNIYDSDFSASFQPKLLAFALLSITAVFLAFMVIVPRFEKSNLRRGVVVQGIFRSNYILFGLPIAISLCGDANVGSTAILIAFVVPLLNLLSVIALEYFIGEKINYKKILVGVVTNPLIIGSVLALVFVFLKIKLPNIIIETARDVATIATPLSLIVLGGSFTFSKLKPNAKGLFFTVLGKLFVMPLCILTVAILLGFRGVELGALLAMSASPTAVSSFTMAQEVGADDEYAAQIVVVASLFSIVSIFLWITILSQMGFLV